MPRKEELLDRMKEGVVKFEEEQVREARNSLPTKSTTLWKALLTAWQPG